MRALRDHLFDTLERLKDEKKPMDVDRAKMVCAVASKIIDTAKVEVKAAEVADAVLSDFLETKRTPPRLTGKPAELPPSRVVDPLREVKTAPRPNGH